MCSRREALFVDAGCWLSLPRSIVFLKAANSFNINTKVLYFLPFLLFSSLLPPTMSVTTAENSFTMWTHPSLVPTFLPKSYQPTAQEVVIGRGRKIQQHEGNINLREIVMSKAKEYVGSTDKTFKSSVITSIGYQVKAASKFGGFVKKDPSRDQWFVVSESCVRATTAQAFRDCLSPSYKSSKFSKQRRRWTAKETETAVSSNGSKQDMAMPSSDFNCSGMPISSFDPLTVVTLQREAAHQYHNDRFFFSVTPTIMCSPFPLTSSSVPSTTSAILQRCLDMLDEDDLELLLDHQSPYEPTPIAEQSLSSLPFLPDDEDLWGLTI